MRIKIYLLLVALVLGLSGSPTSVAATSELTMSVRQTPSASETLLTLYGVLKPNRSGTTINIEISTDGKWSKTQFSTKVTQVGTWRVRAAATVLNSTVRFRAVATIGGAFVYSSIRSITIKQQPEISNVDSAQFIDLKGPGGRIHGTDVSRWQHPNDKPIDFV